MKATEAVSRCAGQNTSGPFVLLKDRRAPFRSWRRIPGANPAREQVAFFGVPVPGARSLRAVVIVDRLLDDGAGPEDDLRLLAAAAALLARHLPGNPEGAAGVNEEEEVVPLGRVLQQEISAWIGPMEYSRRLRSDVLERLVGEVEKIAIAAALEKTGYVQTETARFLGINRNTLARKMQRHGLRGRGG
jgi:DNA-binding protein Fis